MKTDKANSPYRDFLPPLSTEEFAALEADIKANGVLHPVIFDEDGNVLDGHHRLKIDPNAPRKVIKGLTPAEKEAFVFRANMVRRNLSPDQKREAQRRMKETAFRLREEDKRKWTQKRVAEVLGVAQQTVADWFISNTGPGIANKPAPKPDARIKVSETAKPVIAARVEAGESQAQVAADLGVSQPTVSVIVAKERARKEEEAAREVIVEEARNLVVDGIHEGDFREVAKDIPDGSIDLIFTDPPYDRESLPMYGDLAETASRVLVDGGSLICYLGQYQMDKVLDLVTPHLRLWWTLAVIHTGTKARMTEYGIVVCWKPLLWFVKGTRGDKRTMVEDAVFSAEEKCSHDWQQSLIEAEYYVKNLSSEGGIVFDPFCGGGTTAVACKRLNRKFITCDTDGRTLAVAKKRISQHDAGV